MVDDLNLLEFVCEYYYADDLEEAHNILADIVYDGDIDEFAIYEKCFSEEDLYTMPEAMRDFAVSLREQEDEVNELSEED